MMAKNEKIIYVYDSFTFDEPTLLGKLYVDVIKNGEIVYDFPTVAQLQRQCTNSLNEFWSEYKRLDKPQIYKVDLSDKLYDIKQELLAKGGKR